MREPSFPEVPIAASDFGIRYGYEGGQSQLMTGRGATAMARVKELSDLQLDEMFTANAFVALLADAEAGRLQHKTVLWWNSYSSRALPSHGDGADYRQLPRGFHRYFE